MNPMECMPSMCDNWLGITEITKGENRKYIVYITLEVVAYCRQSAGVYLGV